MKKNIFTKIVKKNYNNSLEEILSKKKFSEEVKNTLLTMLYKIEDGYKDYKEIKRETFEKKDYIENLINTIEKDCDEFEFIDKNEQREEVVDRENKKIICLPIENKILYDLAKIQKRNIVVRDIDENIASALTFALNTGNNINIVEPLRDFNGFSWNMVAKDIEELNYNLIYQNLIYLVGNEFIDKWVNNYEPLVDYFDLFKNEIEKKYNKKIEEKVVDNLLIASVKLKSIHDEEFTICIQEKVKNLLEENELLSDKEGYLLYISKKKKQKTDQIKKLDKIINDQKLLAEEYEKRNKELPLEKKIFSIRLLKNNLLQERQNILDEIDKYNKMMKPNGFSKRKSSVELQLKYLNSDESLKDVLIAIQIEMIKCMYIDIKSAEGKNELIDIIYKYRYYNMLPINDSQCVGELEELQSSFNKLTNTLIKEAIDMKTIIQISENPKINNAIIKTLLLTKVIRLQDINIKISKEDEKIYLTIFDEQIEDSKIELKNVKLEDFKIKINKKVKLFLKG